VSSAVAVALRMLMNVSHATGYVAVLVTSGVLEALASLLLQVGCGCRGSLDTGDAGAPLQ
jgi:H+/gluconate symporter-like permease